MKLIADLYQKKRKLLLGLFVMFFVRGSLADHMRVPSGSMLPTIHIGDHVQVIDGHAVVNGKALAQPANVDNSVVLIENQNTTSYHTRHEPNITSYEPLDLVIPEDQYFVMGDNRDNSSDGRAFGLVPVDLLVGRAEGILFSVNYSHMWVPIFDIARVGITL